MKKWQIAFLLFLIVGTVVIVSKERPSYRTCAGSVFGTTYHITYLHNSDLEGCVLEVLDSVNNALSMFNPNSTISKINRSESVTPDPLFMEVYNLSMEISRATSGAFDITVAPAVNAWGFGFQNAESMTVEVLDSIRRLVGYKKIKEENGHFIKEHDGIMLDCSAVAKGFACDRAALMLKSLGVADFMVEIGGEIVVSGKNPNGERWRIGVSRPDTLLNNELDTILSLTSCAMATSGNYRNYYYKEGKMYAHTIDPGSCCPVSHNLLSATVIAPSCATADALATSFMVMGLERAVEFCSQHPEIKTHLIYQDTATTALRTFSNL